MLAGYVYSSTIHARTPRVSVRMRNSFAVMANYKLALVWPAAIFSNSTAPRTLDLSVPSHRVIQRWRHQRVT